MVTRSRPKTAADGQEEPVPKGKARFETDGDGKGLIVQVDRQGFRRLLQTLERLAATGESQTFEKSGRSRRRAGGDKGSVLDQIVFHIDDRS